VIVSGDENAPDGWLVAARAAEPNVCGLVPRAFIEPEEVVLVAPVRAYGEREIYIYT